MIELALVVLWSRLMNWGCAPVIATRTVAADAPTLRAIVSDPASQWRVVAGVSALLRPHAHVVTTRSPHVVRVRVAAGRRAVLWITWLLAARRGTTEVDLVAQTESRGIFARLVLLLGGRRWLRRRLEATLETLGALAHCAAEDLDDVTRHADHTPSTSRTHTGIDTLGTTPSQGAT
jgi:hypothetical protein